MTATALQTSSSTANIDINDISPSSIPGPRQSWTCHNCSISFDTAKGQREHMKDYWQYVGLSHVRPRVTRDLLGSLYISDRTSRRFTLHAH